jgi:hypothetical protein
MRILNSRTMMTMTETIRSKGFGFNAQTGNFEVFFNLNGQDQKIEVAQWQVYDTLENLTDLLKIRFERKRGDSSGSDGTDGKEKESVSGQEVHQ